MPKVSVIVPVYNVEKYVEKCLDTLVNQTLEDIEIIVVNDGSNDNSKDIIEKFIKKYPKKIVYLEKENGGLSDARNYGIPHATGKYIAFLDSDDYAELNTYKDMYELAEAENSDMVECDFVWEFPDKSINDIGAIYNGKHEMIEKARVVAWNKLIKKEILEKNKIKFPKGYRYEDIEFTYKLVPYLERISFLKKTCIHYMQRDNSISNTQNEKTKEIINVFEDVFKYYKEKGIFEEYFQELEYTYTRVLLCSSLRRICKIPDKKVRKNVINLTWNKLNTNFPNWKKNKILKKNKSKKGFYMKSINSFTYRIYTKLFAL